MMTTSAALWKRAAFGIGLAVALGPAPSSGQEPAPAQSQEGAPAEAITISESELGLDARMLVGGCTVRLEYRPAQGAAQYRDTCRRPTAEKMTSLMDMLDAVLGRAQAKSPLPQQMVVFAGRIVQTFPDLAAEAVTAAARTSGWDADAARRSSTVANATMVRLLARTEAGTAIRTADAPHGFRVSGIAVEKVLTARPQRLPFALPPHIVSANSDTELPFDALLWISLRRD